MSLLKRILLVFLALIALFLFIFSIDFALEKFGYEGIDNFYMSRSYKTGFLMKNPTKNDLFNEKTIQRVAEELLRKELLEQIKTWDYKKEDEEKILDELVAYLKEHLAKE